MLTDDGGGGDVQKVTVEVESVESHRGVAKPENLGLCGEETEHIPTDTDSTPSFRAEDEKLSAETDTTPHNSKMSSKNAATVTCVEGDGAGDVRRVDEPVAEPPPPGADHNQKGGELLQPSAAPVLVGPQRMSEPDTKSVVQKPQEASEVSGLSASSFTTHVALPLAEPSTGEAAKTCCWSGGDGDLEVTSPPAAEMSVSGEAEDGCCHEGKAGTFKSEVVLLSVVSGKVSEISYLPLGCSEGAGKAGLLLSPCEHNSNDDEEFVESVQDEGQLGGEAGFCNVQSLICSCN